MEVTNYSSSSSSPPASSVRPLYEIFLSYSGEPTGFFVGARLYRVLTDAGITVFKHINEGGQGKEIDPGRVELIGQSKISMPIISQAYASSKSCLMVLAKMLDCMDSMDHVIIPIFDHVDPSKIGSSAEDNKRGNDSALLRISKLMGYRLDRWDPREEICNRIKDIIRPPKELEAGGTSIPVGINDQVSEMMRKLNVTYDSKQAVEICGKKGLMVGIIGNAGIGKTTLANFLYNQLYHLFEGCSYLEIKQGISRTEPLEHLQSQLVSDLLKQEPMSLGTLEEDIYYIKHRFRNMRVLIVLDDVYERRHVEAFAEKLSWFGSKSRIIVTTRNADLLKIPEVVATHEVQPMTLYDSLRLFHRHAFKGSSTQEDFQNLSRRVVSTTGGVPIAIEVAGSFLCGKGIQAWKEMSDKLTRVPFYTIQQTLMTTYQALGQGTQEIFLDVAFLFVGKNKRITSYMWEDSGCNVFENLLSLSLVKVTENNELSMHDLLRDLGQEIVSNEDSYARRSWLCDHEEALYTLRNKVGTERVQALCLKFSNGSHNCFTNEEFQSLSNLRFLRLDNANLSGDFENLLSNLRWLDWQGCPTSFKAENLHLKNLVILNLSSSKVAHEWEGWNQIEMPRLKVLNLTGCNEMQITPKFSVYPKLEMLILERCFQLVKIDASICQLTFLVSLNLKSCSNLSALPSQMGYMEALKELLIDGTSIQEIPESIARMTKLETLSASNCYSLTSLPKSIGDIEALSMLLLDNAKILELPVSIRSLMNLKRLSLRDCQGIHKVPESIGELGCLLEELDISGMFILELPDSVKNLQQLRVLKMERCHVRKFPSAIGELKKLEEIHASHCRSLKGSIPSDIGNLESLKILILGYSCISSLPSSMEKLSRLQIHDLLRCDNLETLPMLHSSLTCLRMSSKKVSTTPYLDNLVNLEHLSFGVENLKEQNSAFEWHIRFRNLKSLELSHSHLGQLEFVNFNQLKKIVLTAPNLQSSGVFPSSCSVLLIRNCLSLKSLMPLSSLLELELLNSAVNEIGSLAWLTRLEILVMSNCPISHLDGLSQSRSLKRLSLKNCNSIKNFLDVSNLTLLKVLEIHQCSIDDVIGLMGLTSLEELHVSECKAEGSRTVANAKKRIRSRWSASP